METPVDYDNNVYCRIHFLVECVVKEFRVRYSCEVVVGEKSKALVKVNIEVVSIVLWQTCL